MLKIKVQFNVSTKKLLREEKNTKENGFLIFGFVMKNTKI